MYAWIYEVIRYENAYILVYIIRTSYSCVYIINPRAEYQSASLNHVTSSILDAETANTIFTVQALQDTTRHTARRESLEACGSHV